MTPDGLPAEAWLISRACPLCSAAGVVQGPDGLVLLDATEADELLDAGLELFVIPPKHGPDCLVRALGPLEVW